MPRPSASSPNSSTPEAMKHTPFSTLIELARNQTDEASRRLGRLQRAQLGAREQLALLERYRGEYLAQLDERMAQGLATDELRNFQQFIDTLDAAIEQQRRHAEQATQHLDHGRLAWQQSARKLGAYDTLADRLRRHALLALGRREQRDTDERAARVSHGHTAAPLGGLRPE